MNFALQLQNRLGLADVRKSQQPNHRFLNRFGRRGHDRFLFFLQQLLRNLGRLKQSREFHPAFAGRDRGGRFLVVFLGHGLFGPFMRRGRLLGSSRNG